MGNAFNRFVRRVTSWVRMSVIGVKSTLTFTTEIRGSINDDHEINDIRSDNPSYKKHC